MGGWTFDPRSSNSILHAIIGGKVRITTPSGKRLQIEIPKGTRIGDRRRLQGHGPCRWRTRREFTLSEPEELSESQVEALNSLRDAGL